MDAVLTMWPLPCADHDRVGRLDAVDHAAQVHVDDVVPVVEGERVDLAADPDTGVVEQIVDAPGRLDHVGDGAFERSGVTHVELDGVHLCAAVAQSARQLSPMLAWRSAIHTSAPPSASFRCQRGPDPGCTAGDQRDFPGDTRSSEGTEKDT